MNGTNGLPWLGLAVGLTTAAVGALWLGLGRMAGVEPGGLAALGGTSLLAAVMAGRCGQAALAVHRAPVGRRERCGTARGAAPACPRCGAADGAD
jgi:hypothetical protein